MTTRDETRRGTADLAPSRRAPTRPASRAGMPPVDTSRSASDEPSMSLPERLYAARERKGVDLYRAERDTKIRARYLAALERGDYRELPGRRLHEGLPPELRAVPRPRARGGPRPVAARARRRRRAASRSSRSRGRSTSRAAG